jgi:hypothetical protein
MLKFETGLRSFVLYSHGYLQIHHAIYCIWLAQLSKDGSTCIAETLLVPGRMGILSENSKKEYPKSVTELIRLEEKNCARRL